MGRSGYFTCSECRQKRELRHLSEFSLNLAETRDPGKAALSLTPGNLVCVYCDDEAETYQIDDEAIPGERAARNEVEAWNMSGVQLDPGELSAYYQNY